MKIHFGYVIIGALLWAGGYAQCYFHFKSVMRDVKREMDVIHRGLVDGRVKWRDEW